MEEKRESNPRPSDSESDALPTELLSVLRSPIIRPTHAVRWLALARRTGVQNRNRCAATGRLRTLPAEISPSSAGPQTTKNPGRLTADRGCCSGSEGRLTRGPSESVFSSGPLSIHRWRAKARGRHRSADDGSGVEWALVSVHRGADYRAKKGQVKPEQIYSASLNSNSPLSGVDGDGFCIAIGMTITAAASS